MTRTFLFSFLYVLITLSYGQTSPKEEVEKVILSLFEGMRSGDSTMVGAAFMREAQLYTVTRSEIGETRLEKGSLQRFLDAVGSPHDQAWNEPVWDMEIRIDEGLAQAWTPYAFYLGNKFSHCGVDAFHLIETPEGWKIFQLIDTRKKRGCQIPEEVKERFK